MSNDLQNYYPIAEAIALLLHPHAEVVIHNLTTGNIAAIYNNFSKRSVGEESLIAEIGQGSELPDVFPLYSKTNWNGKTIKSISATLRNQKGKLIGLLCINLDLSRWEEMHQFLEQWLMNVGDAQRPEVLFKDDWKEKINEYVSQYLKQERIALKALTKDKKKELVLSLHQKGAFKAKNAASYIGGVLGLSRATIYNYLR